MDFAGRTILITGITGFIGSALAARLDLLGANVRGLSHDPGRAQASPYETSVGDVSHLEDILPAFEGVHAVVHCAAVVNERADPELLEKVNVAGAENVVEACRSQRVKRLVHVSSCAVYGSPQVFGIDERTPLRQAGSPYHRSKVRAEQAILQAGQLADLKVVIARPSQVYGPGSDPFAVRPIKAIQRGRMFLIDGGRFLFKPVYIENLVDGLLLCLTHPDAPGEAFNLVDGYVVPWKVYFGAYAHMAGVDRLPSLPYPAAWLAGLLFEGLAKVQGTSPNINRKAVQSLRSMNSFSNRKARDVLGWEPKVDLSEGLRRTEAWLRETERLPEKA